MDAFRMHPLTASYYQHPYACPFCCRANTQRCGMSAACYPPPPEKKARPPFDGVASLVVDRGAGTGLGPKLWSSPAWVL